MANCDSVLCNHVCGCDAPSTIIKDTVIEECRHLMPANLCNINRNPLFECPCAAWDNVIVGIDTSTDHALKSGLAREAHDE